MKSPEDFAFEKGIKNEESIKRSLDVLRNNYEPIKKIFRDYCDLPEDYYTLLSLWVLGTYFHKSFSSFPYLFINAIKGAGKTRILKLLEALCWNGKITNNITEAVLFRTASKNTMLLDEFEGIAGKDRASLKELLNSAYKKGSKVERMRKSMTRDGEAWITEVHEVYTPIAMANIWGMNEVLGDRCITLVVGKSADRRITRLVEDFSQIPEVILLKRLQMMLLVQLCSYFGEKGYIRKWNYYINSMYNYTTTYNTLTTLTTLITLTEEEEEIIRQDKEKHVVPSEDLKMFDKIEKTQINSRDLELFFPLFLIANLIGESVLDEVLEIAKMKVKEKREEELVESNDICLLEFISKKPSNLNYYSVMDLTREFKNYYQQDEDGYELKWLNSRWFGRALKRLGLVLNKRRMTRGIEVSLNVSKALEKHKIFKSEKDVT